MVVVCFVIPQRWVMRYSKNIPHEGEMILEVGMRILD